MGSTRAARIAGKAQAANATTSNAATTPTKVAGSVLPTPKSSPRSALVAAHDMARPRVTPTPVSIRPRAMTSRAIPPAVAPRASRTPISRVRWVTGVGQHAKQANAGEEEGESRKGAEQRRLPGPVANVEVMTPPSDARRKSVLRVDRRDHTTNQQGKVGRPLVRVRTTRLSGNPDVSTCAYVTYAPGLSPV